MRPAVAQLPGPPPSGCPRDQQGASHSALSLEVCTFLWHPLSLHHLPLPSQVPLHRRPLCHQNAGQGGCPPGPSPPPGTPVPTVQLASFLLPLSCPLSSRAFLSPVGGAERCPPSRAYRGHEGPGAARGRGQESTQTPGHRVGGGGGPLSTSGWAPQTLPGVCWGRREVWEGRRGEGPVQECGPAPPLSPRRDRGRWQLGAENAGGGSDGRPPPWDPGGRSLLRFPAPRPLPAVCSWGPALRNPAPVGAGARGCRRASRAGARGECDRLCL